MNSLNGKERQEMLRRIHELRDEGGHELLLVEFLARTGARQCEAYRLKPEHIDVTQGMIHIRAAKGSRPHLVPVPQGLAERLQDHLREHGTLLAPTHAPTEERSATRLMRAIWAKWCIRLCGFKGVAVSLHGLRASYINQVLAKSGDIHLAQKLAGHRSMASTGRYLANIDVTKRRSRILKML